MNPKDYMKILRPKQWVKNFFVMLPLFFGGELFNTQALLSAVITTEGTLLSVIVRSLLEPFPLLWPME